MLDKTWSGLFFLLFVSLLGGCGVTKHGPGELARKWSCKLREMQIHPVFPPREDLAVGDIYWLPHAKGEATAVKGLQGDAAAYCREGQGDYMDMGTHLEYVGGVGAKLNAHYRSRPSLPASGTSSISVSGSTSTAFVFTASPRSTAPTDSTDLFTVGVSNRTRQVAFPDYLSVDVDQASFGSVGTVSGLPFGLGASRSAENTVRISIPVAESYGLPLLPLISAVRSSLSGSATTSLCSGSVTQVLDQDFRDQDLGAVHVVQEVFFARAIDVEMTERQAVGFSGGVNAATTAVSVPQGGSATAAGVSGSSTQAMADAAMKAALEQLDLRAGLPGVTVSRGSARTGSIVLRRVFDRPVAIGMRSVVLKLDPSKQSDCLVSVRPGGGGATPASASPASK